MHTNVNTYFELFPIEAEKMDKKAFFALSARASANNKLILRLNLTWK